MKLMTKIKDAREGLQKELQSEHDGAVAFEYVIILVIMTVCIFTAFTVLANQVVSKANEIADFIANNGRNSLGTGGVTHGTY